MDADDTRVAALYTGFLKRHGPTYRALHWSSPESQQERFARLAAVGLKPGQSVLDVGCGLGDFLGWLEAQGVLVDYTGLDMTPAMIEHCRATHPRGRFVVGNVAAGPMPTLARFDWVVASGIFAFRQSEPEVYMRSVIERLWRLARCGVAFNALSTRAPHPERWSLFHADPEATLAFCQALGGTCRLTHTADHSDFTVHLWRDAHSASEAKLLAAVPSE
ncbi:class I SAM-dependent methyltransferase [Pararhodospirillum photometricum]|nr:class I SAM-dependent methyltransferase [Pararhodospirillum photometricum]